MSSSRQAGALGLRHALWLALLVTGLSGGCFRHHGQGLGDEDAGAVDARIGDTPDAGGRPTPCGPGFCPAGEVCCDESCGSCAPPGAVCPARFCGRVDAGIACGDTLCGPGERCCPTCPGRADVCVAAEICPDLICPEDPCGGCRGGTICCQPCPETGGGSCVTEEECARLPPACPRPDTCDPAAGVDVCVEGDVCCPHCPGEPGRCMTAEECAGLDLDCWVPMPQPCDPDTPCPTDSFCADYGSCSGVGHCEPRPRGCDDDCPGVCGCDGLSYCSTCSANAIGATVGSLEMCEGPPPPEPRCEGRSYCECAADPECQPLVDLSTGCLCPCDEPFNCAGETCDCFCGGATYRGCTSVDLDLRP